MPDPVFAWLIPGAKVRWDRPIRHRGVETYEATVLRLTAERVAIRVCVRVPGHLYHDMRIRYVPVDQLSPWTDPEPVRTGELVELDPTANP